MNRIRFLRRSALALVLASLAATAPAGAQVVQSTSDADRLADQVRVLAADPRNVSALIEAGRLSVKLNDSAAAMAFFARAEMVDPANPRIPAGRAGALVRGGRPGEALRLFQIAEARGLAPIEFASDRGFAYDLMGYPQLAQRDYKLALGRGQDDETLRRYALSLGVSGKRDEAMTAIDTLLRRGDRAAWRARAFVLAMNGDVAGAEKIATTMMPDTMGQSMAPFLRRLAPLGPADRAFAVHFGELSPSPSRMADARMAPPMPYVAPEPAPVAVAVAPQPAPQPVPAKKGRGHNVTLAATTRLATPVPVPARKVDDDLPPPPAAPVQTAMAAPAPMVQPVPSSVAPARYWPTPAAAAPARVTPPPVSAPVQYVGATPVRAAPPPAPVPARVVQAATSVSAQVASAAPVHAAPPVTMRAMPPAAAPAPQPVAPPLAETRPLPAAQPAAGPAVVPSPAPVEPAPQPVPTPVAPAPQPGFSSEPAAPPAAPVAAPAAAAGTAPGTPFRVGAEDDKLADVMRGIGVPAAELGVPPMPGHAEPAAVPAPAPVEPAPQPMRAAPEPIKPMPLPPVRKPVPVEVKPAAKPDPKAAKPDTKVDPKSAKADPKADPKARKPDPKAAKKPDPAKLEPPRIWVQVAGGANASTLPKAWNGVVSQAPTAFKGKQAWTTPLRVTNRVLTGPFKSDDEAQAFVNQLRKQGISAFAFTSEPGQKVTKLPGK